MNLTQSVVLKDERHVGVICQIVVTISYVVGALGNTAALVILYRSARIRNRKQTFVLRCLVANDLVALLGMLVLMYFQLYVPRVMHNYWFCVFRVILRAFGLGSGCIAIIMALERWLALTRPFQCKRYITYKIVKKALLYLWMAGAALTCFPFLGFGLFYNDGCLRYRDAKETQDVAYAYIFFTFGTLLCVCIVWCNLGVIRELRKIGNQKRLLVRRISRTFLKSNFDQIQQSYPTAEELAFSKLMAVLCISFVVCWMPQMISIPIAQMGYNTKFSKFFFRMADILMAVHFTLDPYIYVLLRYRRKRCNSETVKADVSVPSVPSNTTAAFISTIRKSSFKILSIDGTK